MAVEDWQRGGFGVYVHWPFCLAKCPYCDFNSHVADAGNINEWARAFELEIARIAQSTGPRVVNSVFFGGGTPSLMPPALVARVIDAIGREWRYSNTPEITLEANPTSVEAEKFAGFADAGVNRISMGIQALNDDDLKRLGRMHSVDEALAAFDIARGRFDRVSFDLIYARQDQTPSQWEEELSRALSLAVDHLSIYQLTIEQGTRFGDLYNRGRLRGLPADDDAAQMYDIAQALCTDAGMPAYEVSNHAAEGQESRHNLIYWRYGDYAGIGPGAHGRLTIAGQKYATETPLQPQAWLDAALNGNAYSAFDALLPEDQAAEYLMMSLRLSEGSDLSRFASLGGDMPSGATLDMLSKEGLISLDKDILRATSKGRIVLNGVLRELLT